jgi:hypothetical protein
MKARWFFLGWVCLIIIAILGGIFTRLSYQDYSANATEKIGSFTVLLSGISLEYAWKNVPELEKDAEYVLKIKKIGNSQYQYHTILSQAQVIRVYKGDENLSGKYIYLYEPSFIDFKNESYFAVAGYNIVLIDKEYIVFLNKRKFPEGYKPNAVEQNSFLFVSFLSAENNNCALSKYLLNNSFQSEILDLSSDRHIKYDDIKDLEVVATEKDQLEYYNNFKKQVLELYLE